MKFKEEIFNEKNLFNRKGYLIRNLFNLKEEFI